MTARDDDGRDLEDRIAQILIAAPQAGSRHLVEQLASLREELATARHEADRLRTRRVLRLADAVGAARREPSRLRSLPSAIREAIRPTEPPAPRPPEPTPEPSEEPGTPARHRAPRHPHLRVAHLGAGSSFARLASHVQPDPDRWADPALAGDDLLLIEPTLDGDIDGAADLVERARAADRPVVLLATSRDGLRRAADLRADLVVTDRQDVAEAAGRSHGGAQVLHLDPWVAAEVFNPVGWERGPSRDLLALGTRPEPAFDRPADLAAALRSSAAVSLMSDAYADPVTLLRHALAAVACGTPVVTDATDPDLRRLLPAGVLHHVADAEEAEEVAADLGRDVDRRERLSVPARRHVLDQHTDRERFDAILGALSVPRPPAERVSVIVSAHRADFLAEILADVDRQSHRPHELVLVLHGDAVTDRDAADRTADLDVPVRTVRAPGRWTLGDALNAGLDAAGGDLIAKMDDDDLYGEHHLADLVLARRYSGADVVGKWGQFVHLERSDTVLSRQLRRQERFGTHLPGGTFLMERDLLRRFRFSRAGTAIDTKLWRRLRSAGYRLYSTHRFNYVRRRHGGDHTWQRTDAEFLAGADQVHEGPPRELAEL